MLTGDQMRRFLAAAPAFGRLDDRLRERVREAGAWTRIDDGQTVFRPGDPCRAFLAVVEGRIRVGTLSEEGRELHFYDVAPGEFCVLTIHCLLGRSGYSAWGVTEGAVEGVAVPAPLFERLVEQSAPFRREVFALIARRFDDMVRLVGEVAFQRLDRRLAARLLEQADDGGVVARTHQELASDLGTAREIVSRRVGEFVRKGVLRTARGRIVILDRETLERLAGLR